MDNQLHSASLIMTEQCNLRCSYCFEKDNHVDATMSLATAKNAIDFLIAGAKNSEKKEVYIDIFGGEPTLAAKTVKPMIEYAVDQCRCNGVDFKTILITNGTLWNKDIEDMLQTMYDQMGTLHVQFSLDGPPDMQDANRVYPNGRGSSADVERTLRKYQEFTRDFKNTELTIHSVVTPQTVKDVYRAYDYFRSLGFLGCWFIPIMTEPWSDADVVVWKDQLDKITKRIIADCAAEHGDKYYKAFNSLSQCRFEQPDAACGAGRNYCAITPNGDIYPCHRFYFEGRKYRIGNINDEDPQHLDNRTMFTQLNRGSYFGADDFCEKCDNMNCYRCIAANELATGVITMILPEYCKIAKAENEKRKEIQKIMEPQREQRSCENTCNNGNGNMQEVLTALTESLAQMATAINEMKEQIHTVLEIDCALAEAVAKKLS